MDNIQNEINLEKDFSENNVMPSNELPALSIENKSANAVALLKDFMFSRCGEFTKINNYYYQSWHTYNLYPGLTNSLIEIEVESSNSLSKLAEAVILFGGNPNFSNSDGAYWSGVYVNKYTNPKEFLIENIEQEKCSIKKIRNLQTQIQNESMNIVLDAIVLKKLKYIKTFEEYLSNLN